MRLDTYYDHADESYWRVRRASPTKWFSFDERIRIGYTTIAEEKINQANVPILPEQAGLLQQDIYSHAVD